MRTILKQSDKSEVSYMNDLNLHFNSQHDENQQTFQIQE